MDELRKRLAEFMGFTLVVKGSGIHEWRPDQWHPDLDIAQVMMVVTRIMDKEAKSDVRLELAWRGGPRAQFVIDHGDMASYMGWFKGETMQKALALASDAWLKGRG